MPSCPHHSIICNALLLLSLLFLLSIYTGRMDDIPVAGNKYTPSLSMVLFLNIYARSFPSMFSPFPYSSISFTSSLSFPSFIQLSSNHPSHPVLLHLPHLYLPSLTADLSPIQRHLSHLSTCLPFSLTSLPFYHLPSPLPLLRPSSSPGPSPTCRTIRRSTWSTYTAGLTACAPRTKAPTSSSPPLPSI